MLERIRIADTFIWLDTAQYTNRDWENRCHIKGSTGRIWLTVPVKAHLRKTPNRFIYIANREQTQWREKIIRSIEHNYSRAAFFDLYWPELKEIFQAEWNALIDLNIATTEWLLDHLEINTRMVRASETGVNWHLMGNLHLTLDTLAHQVILLL